MRLVISPLMEEPAVIALPEDHSLARRRTAAPVPLKAFAKDAFVLFGHRDGPTLANATVAACRATGFSPRIGQEVPHIGSAINLVAAASGLRSSRLRYSGCTWRASFTAASTRPPN